MEEFEKLCESCPLLQDWIPQTGDRYFIKNTLYIADDEVEMYKYHLTALKPEVYDEGIAFDSGVHYLSSNSSFGQYFTLSDIQDGSEELRKYSFQLPYIHQIQQKLLQTSFPNFFHLYTNFFKFIFDLELGMPVKFFDSESLWLLFWARENFLDWNNEIEIWEDL